MLCCYKIVFGVGQSSVYEARQTDNRLRERLADCICVQLPISMMSGDLYEVNIV